MYLPGKCNAQDWESCWNFLDASLFDTIMHKTTSTIVTTIINHALVCTDRYEYSWPEIKGPQPKIKMPAIWKRMRSTGWSVKPWLSNKRLTLFSLLNHKKEKNKLYMAIHKIIHLFHWWTFILQENYCRKGALYNWLLQQFLAFSKICGRTREFGVVICTEQYDISAATHM